MIFSQLFKKIENIALAALGIFSLILLGRNSKLLQQNKRLNQENKNKDKKLELNKKVMHVIENNKRTNLAGTIKRMRQKNK